MKKFLIKCGLLTVFVYGLVVGTNLIADPANINGDGMVMEMASRLLDGEIVASPGDYNEGLLQKTILAKKSPETVIIGSSSALYLPWEYNDYQVIGLSGAYLWDDLAAVGLLEAEGDMPARIVICVDPWILRPDQGVGHHESIAAYGQYEYHIINGSSEVEARTVFEEENKDDSWKEFLSFSYFQSSVDYIKKWGLKYCLTPAEERVRSVSTDDAQSLPCIMPDGRHTYLIKLPQDKNDGDANWLIESGHIGAFGEEFTSLSPENTEIFEALIKHLTEEGVEVEIYLPAVYPTIYNFVESSNLFTGVEESEEWIRRICKEYSVTVHGTFNPSLSGMRCEDYSDWLHIDPEKGLEEYNLILE